MVGTVAGTGTVARVEYTRPWLYPKQEEAIFYPTDLENHLARFSLIEASTKSGKTIGCILWLFEQALLGQRHQNFWWMAPVYTQAKIAFTRMKNAYPAGTFVPNETDLKLTLAVNGTVIWFKTGEKPDNLYGDDVHAAVIDEASRMREEAWHAVRTTLTATRGAARIIGNVKGRKNWFYAMARRAESGAPGLSYHKITASDAIAAGVLVEEEVASARADMPEQIFRELFEAVPSDDGGNPFGIGAIARCVGKPSNGKPTVWGWDLAKHVDWTVGIALDEAGRVCRFERFQAPWNVTVDRIVGAAGSTPALVDSTGVGDPILEMLQKKGPRFEGYSFTGPSKQKLMEGLAVAIQGETVTYPDGPIRAELECFEYEYTRTGVRYCVDPMTPVLTKDLRWVPAGSLRIGDELLAFDEFKLPGEKTRNWRPSSVTHASEIVRPCYRLSMADGATMIASAEHLWLVDAAGTLKWMKTEELRGLHASSRSLRHAPHRIMKLLDVWEEPTSYAAGYLAAAFDGEGSIGQRVKDNGGRGSRLLFAQNENAMAQQVREALRRFGFEWVENARKRCIHFGLVGRRQEFLRFLGQIRPKRLLAKFEPDGLGTLAAKAYVPVAGIEFLGDRPVTALGTTTKTFVAAGFASHNSAPEGFHDDCVCSLALAVMHRSRSRKPIAISQDFTHTLEGLTRRRR